MGGGGLFECIGPVFFGILSESTINFTVDRHLPGLVSNKDTPESEAVLLPATP